VPDANSKLDSFLASVEKPAFRIAEIALRNPDDAMDIVQDTMIKLVEKYAHKPVSELRPLFYRILQSRIADHYRRVALRKRIFKWMGTGSESDNEPQEAATEPYGPPDVLAEQMTWENLVAGLRALPLRQQQVFLLRTWQGLSVAETARIMRCSAGSVKTHLSRATHALKQSINRDDWDGQNVRT
jgi:RNA polymerase sigma-70 factor (ECF subfamily)